MGSEIGIDLATRIGGATTDIASRMTGAIRDAARQTGAGFEYLLNTAIRESNLNPNAKAKTSSATGLFQFIDQTWLGTMKQSGAGLGYGKYADAITQTSQGRFTVTDPAMKAEIFALRKDPTANAVMAGAFANSNAKVLTDRLGRKPSDGELYMAHFLGASGAARFISAAEARPDAKAANFFPKAAAANGGIFYDKQGGAKSLKQVYAGLVAKHDVVGTSRLAAAKPVESVTATATATATVRQRTAALTPAQMAPSIASTRDIPARRATAMVLPGQGVPAVQQTASVTALDAVKAVTPMTDVSETAASRVAMGFAPETRAPMFQTLFHADQRGPVAPVVRELWGTRREGPVAPTTIAPVTNAPAAEVVAPAAASDTRINAPLNLFQFLRPTGKHSA